MNEHLATVQELSGSCSSNMPWLMPGSPQVNGGRGDAGWAEALAAVQHGLTHGRRLLMEDASRKVHALLLLPMALQKDIILQVGSVIDFCQGTACQRMRLLYSPQTGTR